MHLKSWCESLSGWAVFNYLFLGWLPEAGFKISPCKLNLNARSLFIRFIVRGPVNIYLLNAYSVASTLLGAGQTVVNKKKIISAHMELIILPADTNDKQTQNKNILGNDKPHKETGMRFSEFW